MVRRVISFTAYGIEMGALIAFGYWTRRQEEKVRCEHCGEWMR
jgi:hypothetical protein